MSYFPGLCRTLFIGRNNSLFKGPAGDTTAVFYGQGLNLQVYSATNGLI